MSKYANSITFIIGKRQTGKTIRMAQIIDAMAKQTLVDILVGHQIEKDALLAKLTTLISSDIIQVGDTYIRTEDATDVFIETGYSIAEALSHRDIVYYINYAKNFIDQGYSRVFMTIDLVADFTFELSNYPELSTTHILSVGTDALYCTTTQRLTTLTLPAAVPTADTEVIREVTGEVV